jgi:hypothetical protein
MRDFSTNLALPVSVQEYHQLFVADTSNFSYDFHIQRGDYDIAVELWCLKDGKNVRTISYEAPTSTNTLVQKVAGSSIKLTETHYHYFINSNADLVLEIHIKDEAARFSVVIKQTVSSQGGSAHVDVQCTMEYTGWFQSAVEELMLRFAGKLVNVFTQALNQTVQNYVQQKQSAAPVERYIAASDGTESDTEYFEVEDGSSSGFEEIKDNLLSELKELASVAQRIESRVAAMERALHILQDSQQTPSQALTKEYLEQFKARQALLLSNHNITTPPPTKDNDTSGFSSLSAGLLIGGTVVVWPVIAISAWNFASKYFTR